VWVRGGSVGVVLALQKLEALLGPVTPRETPVLFYSRSWSVLERSTISMHDERPGEMHFDLVQRDCEFLGAKRLRVLMLWATQQVRYQVSRFDLNYDDRAEISQPRVVFEATEHDQVLTRVRSFGWHESTKVGKGGEKVKGATCYVGSRQSPEFLRVYDGDAVHGEGTGTRWELEAHGERATYLADAFFRLNAAHRVMSEAELAPWFWGLVRRLVDFVERDQDQVRREDCELLDWWAELVGAAAVAKRPRQTELPPSFLRTDGWVRHQIAPSLAYLVRYVDRLGDDGWRYLRQVVIEAGETRLDRRDARTRRLLRLAERGPERSEHFLGDLTGDIPCVRGPRCPVHGAPTWVD
jgi:hypothetical protein